MMRDSRDHESIVGLSRVMIHETLGIDYGCRRYQHLWIRVGIPVDFLAIVLLVTSLLHHPDALILFEPYPATASGALQIL